MRSPEYTNDPTFQTLCLFCKMMGIILRYTNTRTVYFSHDPNINAFEIVMPLNKELLCDPSKSALCSPSHVLANIIAKLLIWDMYEESDSSLRQILNQYCEQIGNGYFVLAEKVSEGAAIRDASFNAFAEELRAISSLKHRGTFENSSKANMKKKQLSPKQAAEQLGVTRKTIYRMIADGRLKAHHISEKSIRIDPKDLYECAHGTKEAT